MDRSEVIYLIAQEYSQNDYGVLVPRNTDKKVFCNVSSVSQSEWFEGGRNGLNPQYRMTMFKYDYSGENIIRYKDVYYSVYRTYEAKNDQIELYVEQRRGSGQISTAS